MTLFDSSTKELTVLTFALQREVRECEQRDCEPNLPSLQNPLNAELSLMYLSTIAPAKTPKLPLKPAEACHSLHDTGGPDGLQFLECS